MNSKICTFRECRVKGVKQSLGNFKKVTNNTDGLSSYCSDCLNKTRLAYQVEILGKGRYIINSIKYKVGIHDFVFHWLNNEWIKSQMSLNELNGVVAKYAQT